MIHSIHSRSGALAALLASFSLCIVISSYAQSFTDFEVTTDAGEKFHLTHTQGTNYDIYTEADNKKIGSVDMSTHNPVVIGPDYAANGAAMQRGMAAANKPGHMQKYNGPPMSASPVIPASSPIQQGSTGGSPQDLPPCPMGSMANFCYGSSWTPLRAPEMLTSREGSSMKELFKRQNLGKSTDVTKTNIVRFKGAASPVELGPSPQFCFFAGAISSPTYLLGFVDVKGDTREIEFTQSDRGPENWIPSKRQKQVTQTHPDSWILVSPTSPLPTGQYIIGTSSSITYFDFGIQ